MKDVLIFGLLITVGCVQFIGDLRHLPTLKGLGFALHASPAPRVFTSQQGFETFSNRFYVEWTDHSGAERHTELTRHRYAGLRGPYNRRNAYGAAFAYGPILANDPASAAMYRAVLYHAVCGGTLDEVGIQPDFDQAVTIRVQPQDALSRNLALPLSQSVRCRQ